MNTERNLVLLFSIFLIVTHNSYGQSCVNFNFFNQSQVDNFFIDNPNCTVIDGDLIIESVGQDPILSLERLRGVKQVKGDLVINGQSIRDLSGLDSLVSVDGDFRIDNVSAGLIPTDGIQNLVELSKLENVGGGFYVRFNRGLEALEGLESLRGVGFLSITNNDNLTDISSLSGLQEIGSKNDDEFGLQYSLNIGGNAKLKNFNGLEGIKQLSGYLSLGGSNVTSLVGFENLNAVGGLSINSNEKLLTINGLQNLELIDGDVVFRNNNRLINIEAISEVDISGDITIAQNLSLCACDIPAVCNKAVSANFEVFWNAPGCNTLEEISVACGSRTIDYCLESILVTQAQVDQFRINNPDIIEITEDLTISGEDISNLNGLFGIEMIGGKLTIESTSIIDFSGLDKLSSVGELEIVSNNSLEDFSGLHNLKVIEGNSNPLTNTATILGNGRLRSFEGLSALRIIEPNLLIQENDFLTSFHGFDSLQYLGGLTVISNDQLVDFSGLSALTEIGDAITPSNLFFDRDGLVIALNRSLNSFIGLESASILRGSLFLEENPQIQSLEGLNFQNLGGGLHIIGNDQLTDLDELITLKSIGSTVAGLDLNDNFRFVALNISDNALIKNINGIQNIQSMNGNIIVSNNSTLQSISALENVEFLASGLFIVNNPQLSECAVSPVCNSILNQMPLFDEFGIFDKLTLDISGNMTGCENPIIVAQNCGIGIEVDPNFLVFPNPVETSFSVFKEYVDVNSLRLSSLSGATVYSSITSDQYDISRLKGGLYILEIFTSTGVLRGRLIKK